jgi:hypothetical protein
MLTGINQNIITAFEDLHMSPEQIAQEFDADIIAIKACLSQFCPAFRKAAKADPLLDFSDDELQEANRAISHLLHSDDDNIRFRAAKYLRNDKKGRLDGVNGIKTMNLNVLMFNERLQQARSAKDRSKQTAVGDGPGRTINPLPNNKSDSDHEGGKLISGTEQQVSSDENSPTKESFSPGDGASFQSAIEIEAELLSPASK